MNVLDANDVVPVFTESSYSISVNEGLTTLPLAITNLRYFDGDSTEAFRRSRFAITSVRGGPDGEAGTQVHNTVCNILPYVNVQVLN